MNKRTLKIRHSTQLYTDILGEGLYADIGGCLWEVSRNGALACMVDQYRSELAHVEISLLKGWQVSPEDLTLLVFDKGHGFREQDEERMTQVGAKPNDPGEFCGAAQKRVGRFAPFSLNARTKIRYDEGYRIYSRCAASGPVTVYDMNPEALARGEIESHEVPPGSHELGPYRNVSGSFTLVAIPHSIFKTEGEIREALKWYLPRKSDRQLKILVGGKLLVAPPLAKESISFGGIEAYLERCGDDNAGIWLSDAETSLRCAFCPSIPGDCLPWPLNSMSLKGDIFIPGLLMHQSTSRTSQKKSYFKSAAWKKIQALLVLKVAPFARDLIDLEESTFGDESGFDRLVKDVADLFHDIWGVPASGGPTDFEIEVVTGTGKGNGTGAGGNGGSGSGGNGGHGGGGGSGVIRTRRVAIPIIIDGKTYRLAKARLVEDEFAQLGGDKETILLNTVYASLPQRGPARMEHSILGVLRAVADRKFVSSKESSKYVARLRRECLQKKHRTARSPQPPVAAAS